MKKHVVVLITILIFTLTSCQKDCDDCVVLPDLENYTKQEIASELLDLDISFTYRYYFGDDEYESEVFVSYVDYEEGDAFSLEDQLVVEISPIIEDYFETIEMEYDGPYLDESFQSINYLDPRGGYFQVTVSRCTDGDTAVFDYPSDVYEAIESGAKSTRFLNMDTEETYSGGEEEWGKPASVYTCSLLQDAASIIIQTDPNDNLLGNYGRLLGWIWIKLPNEEEYFLLNYMVVKQGLAQVKYEFGAGETISYGDYTYNEWMHIAEEYAIENELGQWGELLDYYWDYEDDEPIYSRW